MNPWRAIKALFEPPQSQARPITRLSEAEARRLAGDALGTAGLSVQVITGGDGNLKWRICTTRRGAGGMVVIDDDKGAIVERQVWHTR